MENAEETHNSRPMLRPVEAPWRISSLGEMIVDDNGTYIKCLVDFIDQADKLLVMRFSPDPIWLRFRYTPDGVDPRNRFDTRHLPHWYSQEHTPEYVEQVMRRKEEIRREWRENGICPDPGIYEVIDDNWLRSNKHARENYYKQLMLVGKDTYFEVLCVSWSWEEVD